MRIIWTILFSLVLMNTDSFAQNGFITGKVYSQSSKTAMPNAKLVLKKNGKYFGKTQTDHVGNYWFGDLKVGNYAVWVVQDGYCQLEMEQIEIKANSSIQLDLGLVETVANSNIGGVDKVYMVYNQPIEANLNATTHYSENFKNDIQIISDVYNGPEIKIAPPDPKEPSLMEENRGTNYNDSLKGLEKTTATNNSMLGRVR